MFSNLKGLAIPEGNVVKIECNGIVLWKMNVFPEEPTDYELIETYTANGVFTAPEDGWYKIEVFGASGSGGNASVYIYDGSYMVYTGGGGGGGAYALSIVKLKAGDSVNISSLSVGDTASVSINSSMEVYTTIKVKSGQNGTNATRYSYGKGGSGGTASGGKTNKNGSSGTSGDLGAWDYSTTTVDGGLGGASAHVDGNKGGSAADASYKNPGTPESGKSGFVKVYRGYVVDLATKLIDFEYTDNGDGTVTLTAWKETLNGVPSTELVIPDDSRIIL